MIDRKLGSGLESALAHYPVVALVGPRQVGKTTLARRFQEHSQHETLYLDLERPSDLARLTNPELYLELHADKLVILDEIQRAPDLFPLLRSLVDAHRVGGRFLILGSGSPDLIRHSSETLAGRIRFLELTPFQLDEVGHTPDSVRRLWVRGGFPGSFLAAADDLSFDWRESFIRTYLERDVPALGIGTSPVTLRRFWTMIAHSHAQVWNASKLAAGLGVSYHSARKYLDILENTFIVRQLQPFHANVKKRLVKTPKVYLRDSESLHALLRIASLDDLRGHPSIGVSWEGWVCEQLTSAVPNAQASFYRTSGGAEIDLLLERPGGRSPLAFEIKYSSTPALSKGFWSALSDLGIDEGHVVCPCDESYPLGPGVRTLPAHQIPAFVARQFG